MKDVQKNDVSIPLNTGNHFYSRPFSRNTGLYPDMISRFVSKIHFEYTLTVPFHCNFQCYYHVFRLDNNCSVNHRTPGHCRLFSEIVYSGGQRNLIYVCVRCLVSPQHNSDLHYVELGRPIFAFFIFLSPGKGKSPPHHQSTYPLLEEFFTKKNDQIFKLLQYKEKKTIKIQWRFHNYCP